jgi:DNA polymerase III subunit epsilon
MVGSRSVVPLSQLDVLVVDCQATAAAPRGHLLELGWARVGTTITDVHTRLITLPNSERIPPTVARITGISERMMQDGVEARVAWRELSDWVTTFAQQPAPTVIHFARFERPFLRVLAGDAPLLDVVCTHDVARRLLPDLPRRSLRALAGYFGRAVGVLRRSGDHVEATAFVWRELVQLLDANGVSTWSALHEWLAAPVGPTKRARRVWPMPRDVRLSIPDAPGIYRILRTTGDVLYVGKASSLHHRVNSHFRHQHGLAERTLEMLSQARAISFEITASVLEAALLEADEIKGRRPPYNIALSIDDRAVWFTRPDLSERSLHASSRCRVGPFSSAETLDQFAALAHANFTALGRGRWAPDAATFDAGFARLSAAHRELSRQDLPMTARLLRLGARLWREGRRDRDADVAEATDAHVTTWTPETVQVALERLVVRASLARRRARWLTRLVDATVVWKEPGEASARLLIIDNGEITFRGASANMTPPIPVGHRRPIAARHQAFTVARFDRLRVLTTELKRLVAADASVAVRFDVAPALADTRLASALSWM